MTNNNQRFDVLWVDVTHKLASSDCSGESAPEKSREVLVEVLVEVLAEVLRPKVPKSSKSSLVPRLSRIPPGRKKESMSSSFSIEIDGSRGNNGGAVGA